MTTSLMLQYGVIGILVVASVIQVVRKLFPAQVSNVQQRVALTLDQPSRGGLQRAIGRWLQPAKSTSGSCDDGCSSCCGCSGTPPAPEPEEKVVAFHHHASH